MNTAACENTTIGLDLAKNVFYLTEMSRGRRPVRQVQLGRGGVMRYFAALEASKVRCVAMEACGGAQRQSAAGPSMLHSLRRQAVKQRTQSCSAVRSHLAERGLVARRSKGALDTLIERVLSADPARHTGLDLSQVSPEFRAMLAHESRQLRRDCEQVDYYTGRIEALGARHDEVRRLQTVPGIGPLTASALAAAAGDASGFGNGRDFAAWLGLVPRQRSSGGQARSGGISKCGDR